MRCKHKYWTKYAFTSATCRGRRAPIPCDMAWYHGAEDKYTAVQTLCSLRQPYGKLISHLSFGERVKRSTVNTSIGHPRLLRPSARSQLPTPNACRCVARRVRESFFTNFSQKAFNNGTPIARQLLLLRQPWTTRPRSPVAGPYILPCQQSPSDLFSSTALVACLAGRYPR